MPLRPTLHPSDAQSPQLYSDTILQMPRYLLTVLHPNTTQLPIATPRRSMPVPPCIKQTQYCKPKSIAPPIMYRALNPRDQARPNCRIRNGSRDRGASEASKEGTYNPDLNLRGRHPHVISTGRYNSPRPEEGATKVLRRKEQPVSEAWKARLDRPRRLGKRDSFSEKARPKLLF